jgi:sugar lactone lactonase YvrE
VSFWISGGGEISTSDEFLFHATLAVSDTANNCVHAFDAHHGHFVKTMIPSGAGGLESPQGIQFGEDMSMFVASAGTNQILKFNSNGQSLGVFTELPKNCDPKDILFGPDTNLFVACAQLNKVIAFNANSGQQLGIAAQGGGLSNPTGIAFGPGNTLYVVSTGNNRLLRYAQGGYFQGSVQKVESAQDVAFFNQHLFVMGPGDSNAVLVIKGNNAIRFAESFHLHNAVGMCFDAAGHLYVAANNRILRFTTKGHFQSSMTAARHGNMRATYMAVSPREQKRLGGRHDEL